MGVGPITSQYYKFIEAGKLLHQELFEFRRNGTKAPAYIEDLEIVRRCMSRLCASAARTCMGFGGCSCLTKTPCANGGLTIVLTTNESN